MISQFETTSRVGQENYFAVMNIKECRYNSPAIQGIHQPPFLLHLATFMAVKV
jgi:hypothetical protein